MQIAYYYDEQMDPAPYPFNTRGFPANWKQETKHRIAREYGQKCGWYFYRFGVHLGWDEYDLQPEVFKIWRYI